MDLEYLEEQLPEAEEPERNFATIGAVYADGVTLIFDGEETATQKHYRCNTSVFFEPGDRVRIFRDSGTYVVEYVVGPPAQTKMVGIPDGGAANEVLSKVDAADFNVTWAKTHYIPTGGSSGQVLTKNSGNNYDASWSTPSGGVPSGGSNGQFLKKVNNSPAWADANEVPTDGSANQVLTKNSSGYGWAAIGTASGVSNSGGAGSITFRIGNSNHIDVYVGGSWRTIALLSDIN